MTGILKAFCFLSLSVLHTYPPNPTSLEILIHFLLPTKMALLWEILPNLLNPSIHLPMFPTHNVL